jgi:hypothetical protein
MGGIKKKSQMKALSDETSKIGPIPMNVARIETTKSRMNETD